MSPAKAYSSLFLLLRIFENNLVGGTMKNQSLVALLLIPVSLWMLAGCGQGTVTHPSGQANENASSRGILNGRAVTDSQLESFGAILALQMDGHGLCTSVHLGEGYILTAYHCLHGSGSKPALKIYSKETSTLFVVGTNYQIELPESEFLMPVGEDLLPQPDLSLIVLSGEAKQAVSKLRRAQLPTRALSVGEKDVYIAGFGLDSMQEDGAGRLNYGSANVAKLGGPVYVLSWAEKTTSAAGLPGDSGGPLLKLENGRLVVYGIASILAMNEEMTQGGNLYVRLDTKPVQNWLNRLTR